MLPRAGAVAVPRIIRDIDHPAGTLDGARDGQAFVPYGEERSGRMARLRFIADVLAVTQAEDADNTSARRAFVAEKGSIAVDGVSLTVASVDDQAASFTVALIPHTLAATIAGEYKQGTVVNLESDIVARYVARNLRR